MAVATDRDIITKLPLAFKLGAGRIKDTVTRYLPPDLLLASKVMDVLPGDVMCDLFHARVWVPYSVQIKNRDEAFMMKIDASSDPVILTLRGAWGNMKDSEKAEVWKNLSRLCDISHRYAELKKQESLPPSPRS